MRNPVAEAAALPPDVATALATDSAAKPGVGAFAQTSQ